MRMLGVQPTPSFIQGHGPSATSNGIKQCLLAILKLIEILTLLVEPHRLLANALRTCRGGFGCRPVSDLPTRSKSHRRRIIDAPAVSELDEDI